MNSFFKNGFGKNLQETDMFELQPNDTSTEICSTLERNWKKELENAKKSGKPSLLRAIAKTYKWTYSLAGLFAALEESLRTGMPVLIAGLVRYFENVETTPVWHAYAYAVSISASSILLGLLHHIYFYHVQRIGWHMRVSACALMYKKTLRLSQKALGQTTTGQIVNLGATDVIRFDYLPMFLHYLWIGPLQCVAVAVILWQEVGAAILVGMGVLVSVMLLQTVIGRAFGKLRGITAVLTDERVRLMNEIIAGMRIIKMYTWEKPFARHVAKIRRREVQKILLSSVLRAFNVTMFLCQEKLLTFTTLLAYVAMGGEISASKAMAVIAQFNITRTYLLLDEVATNQTNLIPKTTTESYVELKNYNGKWEMNEENENTNFSLKNISVRVDAGKLLAVIGPVGAGKSSFLSAILGELPPTSGDVKVHGQLSFANQVPWVFSGTMRENILFGEPYDPIWYQKVVKACSLVKDIKQLPEGDLTLVGERGVTLSGGQKARVNLARAVYRKDASICLMDDPLSAVDAAVGNHIYEECIMGLMKDKARILVTHQLQLLKEADHIIILKDGKIDNQGTYDELQADGTDFAALLQKKKEEQAEEERNVFEGSPAIKRAYRSSGKHRRSSLKHRNSARFRTSSVSSGSVMSMDIDEFMTVEEPEELREQGSIGGKVYYEYFRVGSNLLILLVFLLIILASHVLYVMNDWWLSRWSFEQEKYKKSLLQNMTSASQVLSMNSSTSSTSTANNIFSTAAPEAFDTQYYLLVYTVLTVVMLSVVLLRAIIHFYLCVTSGIHMHKKMLRAILRSPIRFFDTNPVGRVLNRFSKDMGQIDELLPLTFMDFLFICGIILSVIILASVVNYFVIIIVLPLVVYFIWLRRYFLRTSRDIKRLEGTTRSPVFSLLSSTLQGLLTVRAFRIQNQFEEKFHQSQDLHSSAWYLFLCGSRWFGLRLDLITAVFITAVAMFSVVAASLLNLDPGAIGLTLTYSASMIGLFQWGVRQSAEVENLMTSVERVQQYYQLPSEAADEVPEKKPKSEWPTQGAITFKDVSFAYYKDGPTVLERLTFEIKPKEKIGLVGRTGAGKSSLISALFRLSELVNGEIYIDGIPITPLGLTDLRNSLSIIPQDPILFTGTMRRNLDPFSQYTDDELWHALEQVQLKEVVDNLPMKLDTELAESGSNFSVGQRQLVCLGRAILRKSKILVIDEATANVDIRTDRLIQLTIREKFKHCTVLTIAHRINTIIDSDRVMLLDNGQLKEFDEPHNLLQIQKGYFATMIKSTGVQEAETLKAMAKQSYKLKHTEIQQELSEDDELQ